MTEPNMHYIGFVQTCISCGINKAAADRLYKEAAPAPKPFMQTVGRLFGRGANKAEAGARAAKETAVDLARKGKQLAFETGSVVAKPVVNTYRAAKQVAQKGVADFSAGWREIRPSVPPKPGKDSISLIETVGYPWKKLTSFIRKHPVLSAGGAMATGAYFAHGADMDSIDRNRSRMPTMTPSEKLMHERAANGYGLPGLGLDPELLSGDEMPMFW